ncbi:MAG: aconitate hydratase AcnA [Polyangiaceae bacterium]
MRDTFGTKGELTVGGAKYTVYRLNKAGAGVERLPLSLRVLLENLLRHEDGRVVKREHIDALLTWDPKGGAKQEIAFHPGRVLLQDFTGVPCVVDLAAMREAFAKMGGDPQRINPLEMVDLVIDHSVQIDKYGAASALLDNVKLEYERNRERYVFLKWGQQAFTSFRAVPPGQGICHQVNLEFLATGVRNKDGVAYPDTLVGTDSHTTMINGLGVLGWGVGGIEAEAAMLGQPMSMLIPEVVGFRLFGKLPEGATATDLVLTVTQMLRKKKVVGKFVEFYGEGVSALPLPDRATIANMAPEYGATMGFFPIDEETIAYLRFTGRPKEVVDLVEAYSKEQGLFRTAGMPDPSYSDTLELNLADVVPSLAGPKRPQDRVALSDMRRAFRESLTGMLEKDFAAAGEGLAGKYVAAAGGGDDPGKSDALAKVMRPADVTLGDARFTLRHGAVVIAAITSCTNTSNPKVMLGAGLVAKKAVERGLTVKPWVKTSLAPGSRVVSEYLSEAGLTPYLEALGFHTVGYGCTTCIGNSGPISEVVSDTVKANDLVVASVLSGNRNFEGRVHPSCRMNYLASPPLVVAYALRGDVDADLSKEPVGHDRNGEPVFLKDIWPTTAEVEEAVRRAVKPEHFVQQYSAAFEGDEDWRALKVPASQIFEWDPGSTYVRRPPFFEDMGATPAPVSDVAGARVLALLGDSVTTDHISPAGNIAKTSPAAKYLADHGVAPKDFNSYGARRGNHEVMMRGTFANIRLKNLMLGGKEGGLALHLPDGAEMSIYDAAMAYQKDGVPLVVLAGAEYGTGSSRDWAAKGTKLLGVRAVIAKSFERIHRSNLVGMGVLPLEFAPGEDIGTLGLTGHETIDIGGIAKDLTPGKMLSVTATAKDGTKKTFQVKCRIDTPNEVDYYQHGGILQYVLRSLAKSA